MCGIHAVFYLIRLFQPEFIELPRLSNQMEKISVSSRLKHREK